MLDNNVSRGTGGGRYYSLASTALQTKVIWEKKHSYGKPRIHILTSLWSITFSNSFSPWFPKRGPESENTSFQMIYIADIFCSLIRALCTQHLVWPILADRRDLICLYCCNCKQMMWSTGMCHMSGWISVAKPCLYDFNMELSKHRPCLPGLCC